MSKALNAACLAATLIAAPAAAATPDLARYDARSAGTLAERLVLCDLGRYLSHRPTQGAQRIYVRRSPEYYELMIPPHVIGGGRFYDEDLERAYDRYRAAGQVSRDEVRAAQEVYGREAVREFDGVGRAGLAEQRFFRAQSGFCRDLVRASR